MNEDAAFLFGLMGRRIDWGALPMLCDLYRIELTETLGESIAGLAAQVGGL